METEILRATLRLSLADGVGPVIFQRLVKAFGSVLAVPVDRTSALRGVEGVGEKIAAAIGAVTPEQIDDEIEHAARHNVSILCRDDPTYPASLTNLYDPPAVLYVRGQLHKTDAIAVGIVGSRRCTHYGMEQAERFGQILGRAGFTVISGGARGIDTAAHRGSLSGGGRTVAVMGCGLGTVYPPENRQLFDQIVADGCGAIISELPIRTAVLGGNFPTRNRIISGLSLGVLIVEAARRSGSLITAREAAEQGRVVFAVPGRVDSPMSQGTNELIRGGAILVQDIDDVLEHLGEIGAKMTPEPAAAAPATPANLTPIEGQLLAALAEGPLSLDELIRRSRIDVGQAAAAMTMLVLKGAVAQQPGNMFARKTAGPAGLFG